MQQLIIVYLQGNTWIINCEAYTTALPPRFKTKKDVKEHLYRLYGNDIDIIWGDKNASNDFFICDTCSQKFKTSDICDERPDDFPASRCTDCYNLDLITALKNNEEN